MPEQLAITPILLIGAQKSGTSYLFHLLEQDPSVARAEIKEPKIFSKPCYDGCRFEEFFDLRPEHEFAIDASTSYMHVAGTAEQVVSRLSPETRVIAVLRDPVERAVSGYLHEVKHGRELRWPEEVFDLPAASLEEAVAEERRRIEAAWRKGLLQPQKAPGHRYRDPFFSFSYVGNSCYGMQLSEWMERFPRVQLLDFAELRESPRATVDKVRLAIGLGTDSPVQTDVRRNVTRLRLHSAVRQRLSLHFDHARPWGALVLWRMARLFTALRSQKPTLPAALAESLRADFASFRLSTKDMWT